MELPRKCCSPPQDKGNGRNKLSADMTFVNVKPNIKRYTIFTRYPGNKEQASEASLEPRPMLFIDHH